MSSEFVGHIATLTKFECDGWATEFFEYAFETLYNRRMNLRWWQWRRRREAWAQEAFALKLLSIAAQFSVVRSGELAGKCVDYLDKFEKRALATNAPTKGK
jgi:hypothetical protein